MPAAGVGTDDTLASDRARPIVTAVGNPEGVRIDAATVATAAPIAKPTTDPHAATQLGNPGAPEPAPHVVADRHAPRSPVWWIVVGIIAIAVLVIYLATRQPSAVIVVQFGIDTDGRARALEPKAGDEALATCMLTKVIARAEFAKPSNPSVVTCRIAFRPKR